MPWDSLNKRKMTMKIIKYVAAAAILSAFSSGAFAAGSASTVTAQTPVKASHVTEVEAGSNIAPVAESTGRSMDDAFNVHTLVAGEWY